METKEELKRKIERCDKLGAKKFKKVVLKVEKLKFKLLKKVFPNFLKTYEKYCDKKRDKELAKASTDKERRAVADKYRNIKIAMRREWNHEENRNYHEDPNKPTEIIHWLNWNKGVHKKALIANGVTIGALIGSTLLGVPPILAGIGIAYESLSAFINFQCINLQNSHIYRYQRLEDRIKKREESRNKKNVENYGEAAKVYARTLEGNDDVPTIEELISNIRTQEELEQLRALINAVAAQNARRKQQRQTAQQSEVHPTVSVNPRITSNDGTPDTDGPKNISAEAVQAANAEIERMVKEGQKADQEPAVQKTIGGKK